MKNIVFLLSFAVTLGVSEASFAQSLSVGIISLEDVYRTNQLLGKVDSNISFAVRPITLQALKTNSLFIRSSNLTSVDSINDGRYIRLLPATIKQQYNSYSPYGWNDGLIIPAKGYQAMISGGFNVKYGPLSAQINPEFVFAENKNFSQFPTYYTVSDIPERFGDKPYTNLSWGQSSLRVNWKAVSFGLSNENLWWGPGIRNSLLMSNSAPGFGHLTFNTTKPLNTPIGSLEGQIIGGKLKESSFTPPKPSDWRYLSAINVSYQPKWVPGLFLGLTRSFQSYGTNLKGFEDYFPIFSAFQKAKDKANKSGSDERDQVTSIYARWLLTKSQSEIYFEYGLNDHSNDLRDFLMDPVHSRAYIFGLRKMFSYKGRADEHIQLGVELTQLEQTIDRILRDAGGWYTHYQILQGYTNQGQVIGAGIGPGSNLQSVNISWRKGLTNLGIQVERYAHNNDFFYSYLDNGINKKWTDIAFSLGGQWEYNEFIIDSRLQTIKSMNYQYTAGKDVFNLNLNLGIMYRF